jgi:hypothetical protein
MEIFFSSYRNHITLPHSIFFVSTLHAFIQEDNWNELVTRYETECHVMHGKWQMDYGNSWWSHNTVHLHLEGMQLKSHHISFSHSSNMLAIATKLLLLLYFSQHVSAPTGHLQVEYNINCLFKVPSILQRIRFFVLSAHAVQTTLVSTCP